MLPMATPGKYWLVEVRGQTKIAGPKPEYGFGKPPPPDTLVELVLWTPGDTLPPLPRTEIMEAVTTQAFANHPELTFSGLSLNPNDEERTKALKNRSTLVLDRGEGGFKLWRVSG